MMFNIPGFLAGATIGLGITMIVAGAWPRRPDLPATIARLTGPSDLPDHSLPDHTLPYRSRALAADDARLAARWTERLVERLVERLAARLAALLTDTHSDLTTGPLARALHLDRRRHDLGLLQERAEVLLVRMAIGAAVGLLLPPAIAVALSLLGSSPGIGLSSLACVAGAGALAMVPVLDVRRRAARTRHELLRAVCAVLDLVALERAADAGPVEAIDRALSISDAPPFARMRRALARAQLDGATPWQALRDLAEVTGVRELGDLADILASSGRDGAAVCTSLRARATALRAAITADETAAANTRSELMAIPVAALGLIFMALMAYPAMARLLATT